MWTGFAAGRAYPLLFRDVLLLLTLRPVVNSSGVPRGENRFQRHVDKPVFTRHIRIQLVLSMPLPPSNTPADNIIDILSSHVPAMHQEYSPSDTSGAPPSEKPQIRQVQTVNRRRIAFRDLRCDPVHSEVAVAWVAPVDHKDSLRGNKSANLRTQ